MMVPLVRLHPVDAVRGANGCGGTQIFSLGGAGPAKKPRRGRVFAEIPLVGRLHEARASPCWPAPKTPHRMSAPFRAHARHAEVRAKRAAKQRAWAPRGDVARKSPLCLAHGGLRDSPH